MNGHNGDGARTQRCQASQDGRTLCPQPAVARIVLLEGADRRPIRHPAAQGCMEHVMEIALQVIADIGWKGEDLTIQLIELGADDQPEQRS